MSEQRIASEALDPTGLVQRCVIVQRDEHGFGFTVSGDTKVFVQSVKQGGAAMRAGVQKGDRIIKVNGTLVTNSNHLDVVRLIKSGAYVALTLLGPPPNSPSIAPATFEAGAGGSPWNSQIPPPPSVPPPPTPVFYSSAVITGPKLLPDRNALHDHANQILRNMLKQEEEELQYLCEEYNQHPSPMLLDKKQGAERRASQLRNKLQPDSPDTSSPVRPRSDSRSGYFENIEGRMSFDSQEAESALLSSSGEHNSCPLVLSSSRYKGERSISLIDYFLHQTRPEFTRVQKNERGSH
ncbi:rho guanine nucleotide exchange factor 11-like [Heptranchias perlo]|uniref:rho guanine nucleotide exchange factor 11-like n=1 Tax=Heptranchias perlo TaxID=212740 RepID=UPI00355ACD06